MGAVLFLAGVMRLGFVADFFGKPVLLGYINGVALIVIASQLGKLFGISVESRDFFAILKEIVTNLGDANRITVDLERRVADSGAHREAFRSCNTPVGGRTRTVRCCGRRGH